MYHCIIVTFIKQTINILTFLTDNAVSLALLSLLSLLSVGGAPCTHGGWGGCVGIEGSQCGVVHPGQQVLN